MSYRFVIWQPPPYSTIHKFSCSRCQHDIYPSDLIAINSEASDKLTDQKNLPYILCPICAVFDDTERFGKAFVESLNRGHPGDVQMHLNNFLKKIIRDELKQIIKEEATDPHGSLGV